MARGKRIAEVDAYIKKAAEFARPTLVMLRELFHKADPRMEETMLKGSRATGST